MSVSEASDQINSSVSLKRVLYRVGAPKDHRTGTYNRLVTGILGRNPDEIRMNLIKN